MKFCNVENNIHSRRQKYETYRDKAAVTTFCIYCMLIRHL